MPGTRAPTWPCTSSRCERLTRGEEKKLKVRSRKLKVQSRKLKLEVKGRARNRAIRHLHVLQILRRNHSKRPHFREISRGMHGASLCGMAEKPYDFRERSFLFAVDVVRFARIVADRGYILGRLAAQLVDAGGWSRPTWRKASPVNR